MSASSVIFRLRYLLHGLIYLLGFFAPWNLLSGGPPESTAWLTLAGFFSRQGWLSFTAATIVPLAIAIVCAWVAAGLRTWAAAWLGVVAVSSGRMHGGRVMTEGPYRYLRHPLYVGLVLHTLALALLMPASGAIFAILLVTALDVWLAISEERFLRHQQDALYAAYQTAVAAIVPNLRNRIARTGGRPAWRNASLSEVYFWGVAISFAVLGWRYNAFLLKQGVLVSLGVALVARALISTLPAET